MGSLLSIVLDKYMKPYFDNFSSEHLHIGLSGASMNNLILNQKILEKVDIPLRLKFGLLGTLDVKINSYFNLKEEGVDITLKDIFLCFEMLKVSEWNEKVVIDKYQQSKQSQLKTLVSTKEVAETSDSDGNFVNNLLANTNILVENIYVRYEDSQFGFAVGLMIPKIEVSSVNELWEYLSKGKPARDCGVIFKLLQINDVSLYGNYGKNFRRLDEKVLRSAQIRQELRDFSHQKDWNIEELTVVGKCVQHYIKSQFQDSETRYTQKGAELKNRYVFTERFSIKLKLSYLLNKALAMKTFKRFEKKKMYLELHLGEKLLEGGLSFMAINLDEEQIKAILHLSTVFNSFSNYSHGVLKQKFMTDSTKKLSHMLHVLPQYLTDLITYIELNKNKAEEAKLKAQEKILWRTEEDQATEILMKIRFVSIEYFYSKFKTRELFAGKRALLEQQQGWTGLNVFNKTDKRKIEDQLEALKPQEESQLQEIESKFESEMEKIKESVARQIAGNIESLQGPEIPEDEDPDSTDLATIVAFKMPQLNLSIQQYEKIGRQRTLCDIEIKGIAMDLAIKGIDEINLHFTLTSLDITDNSVKELVRRMNRNMPETTVVSDKVIETLTGENLKGELINLSVLIKRVTNMDHHNQGEVVKDDKVTKVNLNVTQQLLIFGNFFFVNNLMRLCTHIVTDMNKKTKILLNDCGKNTAVKKNILEGFQMASKLRQISEAASDQIKQAKLQKSGRPVQTLYLNMNIASPKVIIDEYLLSEKVQDPKRPLYLLLDMGSWLLMNEITDQSVEQNLDGQKFKAKTPAQASQKKISFDSFDMKISDIKILYNYCDYKMLLIDETYQSQKINFTVFDKFTLAFQYQSAMTPVEKDPEGQYPKSQVNLKFQKMKFSLDRYVFRQVLKVKIFITEGSFNDSIKQLTAAIANDGLQEDQSISQLPAGDRSSQIKINSKEPDVDAFERAKPISSMRINLIWQGLEIKQQIATFWRPDKTSHLVFIKTRDILSMQASDFQISVHMSDFQQSMSVIVLLKDLRCTDLENTHYYWKDMVKVHQDKKAKTSMSEGLFTGLSTVLQSPPSPVKEKSLQKASSQVAVHKIDFHEMDNFQPRNRFLRQQDQVSVYFGSKVETEQNSKIAIEKQKSLTILQFNNVHLIGHFKLIADSEKFVFDAIEDLSSSEDEYKRHLNESKMVNNRIQTQLTSRTSAIRLQQESASKELVVKKQKIVIKESSLSLAMPNLRMIIPTALDDENCVRANLGMSFQMNSDSKEIRYVEFATVKNEETGLDEEKNFVDDIQDQKSEMLISMDQLHLAVEQNNKGSKPQPHHKETSDYILTPLDLQLDMQSTAYFNHQHYCAEEHFATLPSSLQQSRSQRFNRIMRQKLKAIFKKHEMINSIQLGTTKINASTAFDFKFRVKQMKMYFELTQLIYYHQTQITAVKATKFDPEFYNERDQGEHDVQSPVKESQPVQQIDPGDSQKPNTVEIEELTRSEIMTLPELVLYWNKADENQETANRIKSVLKKRVDIVYDVLEFNSEGFKICLMDDLTSKYVESLLNLRLKDLDLRTQSLCAKPYVPLLEGQVAPAESPPDLNIVEQYWAFQHIMQLLKDSDLLADLKNQMYSQQLIQIIIEFSYFNQKALGMEDLIEKYNLGLAIEQKDPMKASETRVTSDDMLDINLTYGCILSIYKVLQFLKEDEEIVEKKEAKETVNNFMANLIKQRTSWDPRATEQQENSRQQARDQILLDVLLQQSNPAEESETEQNNFSEDISAYLPKYEFHNHTQKQITFSLFTDSDEQYQQSSLKNDTGNDPNDQTGREKYVFSIEPSVNAAPMPRDDAGKTLEQAIEELFSGWKKDELRDAQLYMNFTIEGYKEVRNILLNSNGIFGHAIETERRAKKRHCVTRIIRNKDVTEFYWEANAVFQNCTPHDLTLRSMTFGAINRVTEIVDQVQVKKENCYILPLTWFEKNVQAQVDFAQTEYSQNAEQYVFRWGKIKEVLDPNLTQPYYKNTAQIKLNYLDKWNQPQYMYVALELALLQTRTKIPQFLISVHPLTKFVNLMYYPVEIIPKCKQWIEKAEKKAKSNIQKIIDPNQSKELYELNLSSLIADNKFRMKIEQEDTYDYKSHVTWDHKQVAAKSIEVVKGVVVELQLVPNEKNKGRKPIEQSMLIVIEKVQAQETVQESSNYENLSLRQPVFLHTAREKYEIYTPLIAVNETDHRISLQSHDKKSSLELPPKKNLIVGLQCLVKYQMHIKLPEYELSQPIDLKATGVNSTLTMKWADQSRSAKKSEKQKQVTIGYSLKVCDAPFVKTKILRFTNFFTFINKMPIPVLVRCIKTTNRVYVLDPGQQTTVDFASTNTHRELQVRLLTVEDNEWLLKNKEALDTITHCDTKEITLDGEIDQPLWSRAFFCDDPDEFQINLPKNDSATQRMKVSSYIQMLQGTRNQIVGYAKFLKKDATSWDYMPNNLAVRVTVTNDGEFLEKYYCIIQRPILPDFLVLNYLDRPVTIRERHKNKAHVDGETFIIPAKTQPDLGQDESELPGALPIIISQHAEPGDKQKGKSKVIEITLDNQEKLVFSVDDPEEDYPNAKIRCESVIQGTVRMIKIMDSDHKQYHSTSHINQSRKKRKLKIITDVENHYKAEVQRLSKLQLSEGEEEQVKVKLDWSKTFVHLKGIGLSFVDQKPTELLYVSLLNIRYEQEQMAVSVGSLVKTLTDYNCTIENLQMDAMQNEYFPVLLGAKDPYRNIERLYQAQNRELFGYAQDDPKLLCNDRTRKPFLSLVWYNTSESDGIMNNDTIESLTFDLLPIELKLHISLVVDVNKLIEGLTTLFSDIDNVKKSNFVKELNETQDVLFGVSKKVIYQDLKSKEEQKKLARNVEEAPTQQVVNNDSDSDGESPPSKEELCPFVSVKYSIDRAKENNQIFHKMFIEKLFVNPIRMFVTLRIRGIETILSKTGPLAVILNLGSNFADISDAEFNFTEYEAKHTTTSQEKLQNELLKHYQFEAVQQFYQLVGSQDIIGNPSAFIANVSKGTDTFYDEPLNGFLESGPCAAVAGVAHSVMGIATHSTIAVTNSCSGITGSVYLGLKNMCGAGLTHQDLEKPLTFLGGVQKSVIGCSQELVEGFGGVVTVPYKKMQNQGKGPRQYLKGQGQGLLQFFSLPITIGLRATYDVSMGIKQQLRGVMDYGQRYRYPRYFDQNQKMYAYDHLWSHAHAALINTQNGAFANEVIKHVYDVSIYTKEHFQGYFKDRIMIITNKHLLFIRQNRKVIKKVPLYEIKGIMIYFQKKRYNSIIVEDVSGKIIRLETQLPEVNKEITQTLKATLDQLTEMNTKQKQKDLLDNKAETLKQRRDGVKLKNLNLAERLEQQQQSQEIAEPSFESANFSKYHDSEWTLSWETIPNQVEGILD